MSVEGHSLLTQDQISAVDDLRDDVCAVLVVEIDEVWLAVFHLVDRRSLTRSGLDVREVVIVVDLENQKGRETGLLVEVVVELELGRVVLLVGSNLLNIITKRGEG